MSPTKESFIVTSTHNYISRSATLEDANRIDVKGRCIVSENVHLAAPLRMQRYVFVGRGAQLQFPEKMPPDIPIVVGGNTLIGSNVQSRAAAIGSNCIVCDNVTLGNRVMIKDNCIVQSSIPDDTVVPPFTLINKDGTTEVLSPGISSELRGRALEQFSSFVNEIS